MKTIINLTLLTMGCFSTLTLSHVYGAVASSQVKQDSEAGSSSLNPIVLKGIKKVDEIREAQRDYVRTHYKGYTVLGFMYTMRDGRYLQIVSIADNENKTEDKLLYFDMTDLYKKLGHSQNKETRRQIKELEAKHLPLKNSDLPAQ